MEILLSFTMEDEGSAIAHRGVAVRTVLQWPLLARRGARLLRTALVRVGTVLAKAWRDNVYAQQRWLELQSPWDHEGPLRWRRAPGGYRLVGAQLPSVVNRDRPDSDAGGG